MSTSRTWHILPSALDMEELSIPQLQRITGSRELPTRVGRLVGLFGTNTDLLSLLQAEIAARQLKATPLFQRDVGSIFRDPMDGKDFLRQVAQCGVRVAVIGGIDSAKIKIATNGLSMVVIDVAAHTELTERHAFEPTRLWAALLEIAFQQHPW